MSYACLAGGLVFVLFGSIFAVVVTRAVPGLEGTGFCLLAVAAAVGGYMAMNIGANDVANNLGPAVGSGVIITLGWAIVLAAVFEALGAVIAGGEVVDTVKGGIINPAAIDNPQSFIWLMLAALLAGALWLNVATSLGAPVSTTHSIIGAVMGAGIAAGGWGMVNWGTIAAIVGSWVLSPVLGGVIAVAFLYLIKRTITYQSDMTRAASKVVPVLLALMGWAFVTFMLLKGIGQIAKPGIGWASFWGLLAGVAVYLGPGRLVAQQALRKRHGKDGINELFTWPLICAAALLSFAHGANDVANRAAQGRIRENGDGGARRPCRARPGRGRSLPAALRGRPGERKATHVCRDETARRRTRTRGSSRQKGAQSDQEGDPARIGQTHRPHAHRHGLAWIITVPATAVLAAGLFAFIAAILN